MVKFDKYLSQKKKDVNFLKAFDYERALAELAVEVQTERQKSHLSQSELALKAHITQQQLSKVEKGINCNLTTFVKVLEALNLRMEIKRVR